MTSILLTVHEVARALNMATVSVRRLIWTRKIPSHRLGRAVRVAQADLERLVRESRVPADPDRALPGALATDDVMALSDVTRASTRRRGRTVAQGQRE
jgi:excisionase family DNA binding protein